MTDNAADQWQSVSEVQLHPLVTYTLLPSSKTNKVKMVKYTYVDSLLFVVDDTA
jgi:hypothetical protein